MGVCNMMQCVCVRVPYSTVPLKSSEVAAVNEKLYLQVTHLLAVARSTIPA